MIVKDALLSLLWLISASMRPATAFKPNVLLKDAQVLVVGANGRVGEKVQQAGISVAVKFVLEHQHVDQS